MVAESGSRESVARTWYALPVHEVLEQLGSGVEGLSSEEARIRLQRYGANSLPPPRRRSAWLRFLQQFNNPLVIVLLGAAVVTLTLGHRVDAGVIVGVTLLNAIIGFVQEGRAERALEAIRSMLSPVAAVLRDGLRIEIPAAELVPGDIVLITEGDRIPADLRLFETRNLRIEESILTGEALPVEKAVAPVAAVAVVGDRTCMAHSGTLAVFGYGRGVVVATGVATEIGSISSILAAIEPLATPLLRKMAEFGRLLTIVIAALAVLVFALGAWIGSYPPSDMFMVAVGIAVAAIPEGLPAIVTITLAIGVQRMAKRRAIVRQLPAVETLGAVTVICTDKTGTLTKNEMTVRYLALGDGDYAVSGTGYAPHGGFVCAEKDVAPAKRPLLQLAARAAALCNDAVVRLAEGEWRPQGDPTEAALISLALKAGVEAKLEGEITPRVDVIPFEAEHRFMATLHHDHAGQAFIYLKGAVEAVLGRCGRLCTEAGEIELDAPLWLAKGEALAADGLRVLALATKRHTGAHAELQFADVDAGFALIGLVGIIDPPREEAIRAVAQCQAAGIRVKMITGDHALTARTIGSQLGLAGDGCVLTGPQIEAMDEAALMDAVGKVDIFARASPVHKLSLVKALQANGAVVAMTGDGVNDAPALKRADVGVAMGLKGTEAAREAAGMVLTDDNFASIANAVEEGRTVYENIKKSVLYILPTNGGEAGGILVAMLLALPMPITAVQILWINMVTEVTLSLSLAFLPAPAMVMRRPPRDPAEPLISRLLLWRIALVTAMMTTATIVIFLWELELGATMTSARTAAVNMIVVAEMAYLLNSRSLHESVLSLEGVFGNRPAWIAIALLTPIQLAFTYVPSMQALFGTGPVAAETWVRILIGGALIFLAAEAEKAVQRWRMR